MCGIVAALPCYDGAHHDARSESPPPDAAVPPAFPLAPGDAWSPEETCAALDAFASALGDALDALATPAATAAMADDAAGPRAIGSRIDELTDALAAFDRDLDTRTEGWAGDAVERLQTLVRQAADRLWALRQDRYAAAGRARALCPERWTAVSVVSYAALNAVLDALDRLEVRGRDSAGVTVWVETDAADAEAARAAVGPDRADDVRFRGGSAVATDTGLVFAYKRSALIGSLGDNTRYLRAAVLDDGALHRVLALPSARVTVLAHTRWASVGRMSEPNAHPVDSRDQTGASAGPFCVAAVNGDVDNYLALQDDCGYDAEATGVTTDAKLVPLLLSREARTARAAEALTATLRRCEGSMAIAAQCASEPGTVLLGVKGSGQSLYAGFGPGGYLVASEVYGLVGVTSHYVKFEGHAWPGADSSGTVVVLTRDGAGRAERVRRADGDGLGRPLSAAEVRTAEVTTRDLALGDFGHYLEKEIHEAAGAFHKTLRGRIRIDGDHPRVALPPASLPDGVRAALRDGRIAKVVFLGQGTAAVACQGIAHIMQSLTGDRPTVSAITATEFSAWWLTRDMSDTLVVAVSQSGSTTDTNRTVDLVRERGASVLAIVNRRDSDLVDKSDGTLYTSDGRDVELSVASTKAFYAQIAAGCLLSIALAIELGAPAQSREAALLQALQRMPDDLRELHTRGPAIAQVAERLATRHPDWAVVGSGPNRVAAAEIRIKLSELCYRTISADAVEDKKHIDLSAEAMVLVCAAGAPPHQMSDLVKEVEILKAHQNHPIVVCDEGTEHLWPTSDVVPVPAAHPELAWILATAAGHLFAYHAARTIDAAADTARLALTSLDAAADRGDAASRALPVDVAGLVDRILDAAERGDLRGVLGSRSTAMLARAAYGRAEENRTELARAALTAVVDELARPIDTVKHQAKTVTVGTSRSEADLYDNAVVETLRAIGADPAALTYPVLDAIRAHARVIREPVGATRYQVKQDAGGATVFVTAKSGVATHLRSRAEDGAPLTGTKKRVADLRVPLLVRGAADGRTVLIVPEQSAGDVAGISVVHVELRESCPLQDLKDSMRAAGDRFAEIVAAVSEVRPDFRPDDLSALPTAAVLLDSVEVLAGRVTEF